MTDYTDPDRDWTVNGRSLWRAVEVLGLFGDGASPAEAARVLLQEAGAAPAPQAVRLPSSADILDAINAVRAENDGHYGPDPEDLARGIATRLEAAQLRSGVLVDGGEITVDRLAQALDHWWIMRPCGNEDRGDGTVTACFDARYRAARVILKELSGGPQDDAPENGEEDEHPDLTVMAGIREALLTLPADVARRVLDYIAGDYEEIGPA